MSHRAVATKRYSAHPKASGKLTGSGRPRRRGANRLPFRIKTDKKEGLLMLMQRYALILTLGLLISSCGNGSSAPPPVTIGGTVTGLVGKLVVQNNGGDNLSVAANGAFTFATPLANGATYAASIMKQPAGPTCVISNGSGTAATTVTSILVTCTIDPATFFLPMSATSASGSTAGANGLFVLSSKSPGDPPIQVTTGA